MDNNYSFNDSENDLMKIVDCCLGLGDVFVETLIESDLYNDPKQNSQNKTQTSDIASTTPVIYNDTSLITDEQVNEFSTQ